MNRGRGRGRGRGRAGASASPHSPADHRSHYDARAEPSSSDRFSPGNQMSWQKKTDINQAQPVASEAQLSSRDNTACELKSEELNNRLKIVGSDVMHSKESDMTPDSGQVNSISRERSWKSNQRPNNQKNTQWKDLTGWKEASPTSYKVTLFSNGDNLGTAKSAVLGKGSANGPLNLDRSLMLNSERLKSSSSIEYAAHEPVGGSETLKCDSSQNSDIGPLNLDRSLMLNFESLKSSSSIEYAAHEPVGGSETLKLDSSQNSESAAATEPFDICPPKVGGHKLNPSLNSTNKEKRNQIERSLAPKASLLRSGMVLLKNFISVSEQVKIVNECRKLGLGTGGFYQPGYRDGAKLSLKMMCLGKNWDPETRSYGYIRPIDGAKPPPIPNSFFDLVRRSVKESHTLIAEECGSTEKVQAILPSMTPDICLVNFYATTGRLGLHQDRDESEASRRKGLPVVSISIGDNAEFLYGDQAEVDKAEKITLESGDVLIFGGQSRHVFHGVSLIKPDTAPKSLLHMTNLRSGRLNLTFREY